MIRNLIVNIQNLFLTTQLQSVNISQTSLYLFFSEKKYRKSVLNIRKISLFECFSSVLQAAAGGARV